jgi:hypothetical protein
MTLEPFIGGACFVDIRDRKHSTTLQIAYDHDRRRLALPERRAQGPSPQAADAEAAEPAQTWTASPAPADDLLPAPVTGAGQSHSRRDGRLTSA